MPSIQRPALGAQLNLSINLIPETMPNRKGTPISPKYITIHNTSNRGAGANAAAHSRMVTRKGYYEHNGSKRYVSWHFTVDDKEVIKHLPVNERAIHAGSGNGKSIAIEICMHSGIDQAAADLRAQRLVAVLMHDLKISDDNIVPHKHWTGKACPTLLLGDFEGFKAKAKEIADSIEQKTSDSEVDLPQELLSESEINDTLYPSAEAVSEAERPAENDPLDEHESIATEVEAFIE